MTLFRSSASAGLGAVALAAALLAPPGARAALTPLAETPLQALNLVKPNIMFTVDDSGSMSFEFLPDYTAEGPPPLNGGIYYCRDLRNCGGIVDSVNGLPLDPVTGLRTWAIYKADPPIRSSAFNKLYYDPSVVYNPGKAEDGSNLPCEGSDAACPGPWTSVYGDGYAGYPGANNGGTVNLTTGYPDTAWCNSQAFDPPTATDIATALSDGSKCRLNGRAYPAFTAFSGSSILWTAPKVDAGYNYPNAVNPALACGAVNEYCQFNVPASLSGSPYYYTTSRVQYCRNRDAAGFGLTPCSDRWDETTYKYVRYGTDATKAFDPASFSRIDITPAGCRLSAGGSSSPPASTPCPRGSYAQEMTNFARWYSFHRNRILVMKTAGGIAFSALTDQDARVGLHTLRFGWNGSYVPNGNTNGNPFLNIADFNAANKKKWFENFYGLAVGGGTPLPDAVYRIGEYFSNSGNSGLPGAVDPLDPVTGRCQQNYHLLSTDGYWNEPLSNANVGDQDRLVPGTLPGAIPGFNPGSPFPPPYNEGPTAGSNSLADLAMYYWIHDIRPGLKDSVKDTVAPWQHVTLYSLAIGAQGNILYPTGISDIAAGLTDWPQPTGSERPDSIDDLWHAAINSRGKFFNPANSQQLAESIVSALSDFTSQSGTGAAVGIAGAQFSATRKYGYRTSYESGGWGDVKKYALDPVTGALPAKPDGNPVNPPLWSAATQLDAQAAGTGWDANRRIVTMTDGLSAVPVPFRLTRLSASQKASLNAGWSVVSNPPTPDLVLNYLRGDHLNEGVGTTNFRTRSHVLGDIVYSGAVPVGAPAQPYDDAGNPGYPAFAASNQSRTPMVYVGANDGMVHVIDDSFTADAGKEVWAYVPKALYTAGNPNSIARTPSSDFQLGALSYRRGGIPLFSSKFYVNATPRIWDVDLANTNTKVPPKTGNDWRTILVGGLGAGGRAIYALDVTTPVSPTETEDDIVSSGRVLWEFTHDNLGYVYDAPTLVKTRRYGWVVLVASGYNNKDGKGILFVLNPKTGTILTTLSTPVGSDTEPSGLSTIRAFTGSRKDPYVLQAYGGDLLGNVWRFDLSDPDDATKWKVELVATLKDAGGKPQPITTGVRVEIDQSNNVDRYLFVGTGKLLDQADLNDATVSNTLYVIRDGTRTAPEPAKPYTRADLNAVAPGCIGTPAAPCITGTPTGRGWYQDSIVAKQKIITDVTADVQTVVFALSKPADDSCEGALVTDLYAREYGTGNSVLQSGGGSVVASITDIGAIAGVTLIQGQPGAGSAASGDVRAQVTTMKGQVFSFGVKVAAASSPKHRVSWRLLSRD